MNIKDVVIDAYATIGKSCMAVGVTPAYAYENGQRTGTVIGYKYEIVMPERMFEKLSVRILGEQKLEIPENETPTVYLEGLTMKLYWSPQGYKISATADNIRLANPPKKA